MQEFVETAISIVDRIWKMVKDVIIRLYNTIKISIDTKKFKAYMKHKKREKNRKILYCKSHNIKYIN